MAKESWKDCCRNRNLGILILPPGKSEGSHPDSDICFGQRLEVVNDRFHAPGAARLARVTSAWEGQEVSKGRFTQFGDERYSLDGLMVEGERKTMRLGIGADIYRDQVLR